MNDKSGANGKVIKKGSRGQTLSDNDVGRLRDIGLAEELLAKQIGRLKRARDRILAGAAKVEGKQVTDHAIIRYLERVEGVDMECVKERIRAYEGACTDTKVKGLRAHPDGNLVVVTPRGVMVTVLPPGSELSREVH